MTDYTPVPPTDSHIAHVTFPQAAPGVATLGDLTVPGLHLDGLAPQQIVVAVERHAETFYGRPVRVVLTSAHGGTPQERQQVLVSADQQLLTVGEVAIHHVEDRDDPGEGERWVGLSLVNDVMHEHRRQGHRP